MFLPLLMIHDDAEMTTDLTRECKNGEWHLFDFAAALGLLLGVLHHLLFLVGVRVPRQENNIEKRIKERAAWE